MRAEWARAVAGGAVVLPGFHAVKHALRFGADVRLVVAASSARVDGLAEALAPDLRAVLAERVLVLPDDEFARLTLHHTGIAAVAAPATAPLPLLTRTAPLVLLDEPRHPGNAGAVVRVAAGLGASGVATTGSLDPWSPAVVRGAAGLQFALPVRRVADPAAITGPLFAFDDTGRDARAVTIPDDAVLAFGSERSGLTSAVLDRADTVLALPMRAGVASYNLATSVSMALYQWVLARRD